MDTALCLDGRERWTADMSAYVEARWAEGATACVIADEMTVLAEAPVSTQSIYGVIRREFPHLRGARRAELRARAAVRNDGIRSAIAAGGETQIQVAKRFGVSAVTVCMVAPVKATRDYDLRGMWQRLNAAGIECGPPWARTFPVRDEDEAPVTDGTPLVELGHDACRFPIGKDADGGYRFCGCQRFRGNGTRSSYCAMHRRVASRSGVASSPQSITPAKAQCDATVVGEIP